MALRAALSGADSVEIRVALGRRLLDVGQPADALQELERAIALDPPTATRCRRRRAPPPPRAIRRARRPTSWRCRLPRRRRRPRLTDLADLAGLADRARRRRAHAGRGARRRSRHGAAAPAPGVDRRAARDRAQAGGDVRGRRRARRRQAAAQSFVPAAAEAAGGVREVRQVGTRRPLALRPPGLRQDLHRARAGRRDRRALLRRRPLRRARHVARRERAQAARAVRERAARRAHGAVLRRGRRARPAAHATSRTRPARNIVNQLLVGDGWCRVAQQGSVRAGRDQPPVGPRSGAAPPGPLRSDGVRAARRMWPRASASCRCGWPSGRRPPRWTSTGWRSGPTASRAPTWQALVDARDRAARSNAPSKPDASTVDDALLARR